jgi:glycosyltransferase involved in cell wall biosynthesis
MVGPITSPCNSWQSVERIGKTFPEFDNLPEYNNNPTEYSRIIKEKYSGQFRESSVQLAFFSTLIKSVVVSDIGVLSEEFGIGFGDDDDYCSRAREAGWKIAIAKDVFVFHNHRTTFNSLYSQKEIRGMLKKNSEIFNKKHMSGKKRLGDLMTEHYLKKEGLIINDEADIPMIDSALFENRKVYLRSVAPLRFYFWLSIFGKNNFDVYLVNNESNEFFLVSNNQKAWNKHIRKFKKIDLFCVKKDHSKSVFFFSHASKKGGSEKSLVDLVRGLIKRGILCTVLLPSHGGIEEELRNLPVAYRVISYPWWAKNNVYKKERKDNLREMGRSLRSIRKYVSICDPHVIYTNTSVINIGALVAKKTGKPHVWHIRELGSQKHGIEFYSSFENIADFIYKYSDKIIFNSKMVREHYEKFIPSDKSEVVYNYVNQKLVETKGNEVTGNNFFTKPSSLRMVMIGAVSAGKNQMDAVTAAKELVQEGTVDIELLIVGGTDPEYHKQLNKEIYSGEIENFVHFTGQIENVFPILKEADVFLICSHDEAFGRVTVEAMLMKKPIIGAKSGGTPELVRDNFNGFLYETGNIEMLKEKIRFFIDNKDKIKEFGENGYAFSQEEFTEEGYSGRVSEIVSEFIDKYSHQKEAEQLQLEDFESFIRKISRKKYLGEVRGYLNRYLDLPRKAIQVLRLKGVRIFGEYLFRYFRYGKNYFK